MVKINHISFLKQNNGQALVEMALVLPLLLTLIIGTIEVGRIMGTYMMVGDLARQGARYGILGHSDIEINNFVISQNTWLEQDRIGVSISPEYANRLSGDSLQVIVNYSLDLLTPFSSTIFTNPVPISAKCIMRME